MDIYKLLQGNLILILISHKINIEQRSRGTEKCEELAHFTQEVREGAPEEAALEKDE